ncbi:uncharacterized protein [Diabrotica undecimpunctata]|uniref:uncharacterized protein isoform X2 n=1 Tax=Diabrotica undecimpunctata TaxID=50387 RepID=UPI003B63644C
MEFKVEVKEGFVECSERYIGNLLCTSTNIALKNEPEDKSAIEIKAEIKKEFDEDDHGYVESQLTKSIDLGDLELYTSTNNIEAWEDKPDDKSAIGIKTEIIKKEFAQDDQTCIESQLTIPHDIGDLNNEPDEDNSDAVVVCLSPPRRETVGWSHERSLVLRVQK